MKLGNMNTHIYLTGVCSFDIIKCFDTINHAILLKKMYFYGFNDHTSKWFQSYLNKREQIASCRNQLSGKCQLQIGVPQGSVLGPLLFLIYVNDINRHVHLGSCNIYADDTLKYCTGSNITELKYNIQKCVTDVHEWYESNKLVINTSKSNVMLLTTRQMLSNIGDTALNVFIGKLHMCRAAILGFPITRPSSAHFTSGNHLLSENVYQCGISNNSMSTTCARTYFSVMNSNPFLTTLSRRFCNMILLCVRLSTSTPQ